MSVAEAVPAHDRKAEGAASRSEYAVGQILRIHGRSVLAVEHQIIRGRSVAQLLKQSPCRQTYRNITSAASLNLGGWPPLRFLRFACNCQSVEYATKAESAHDSITMFVPVPMDGNRILC